MSDGVIASLIAAGSALAGALLAWASGRFAARESASADVTAKQIEAELQKRRDTIADRDALIDRAERRLVALEERVTELEAARAEDARLRHAMREHVYALQRQIWNGDSPPPVAPPIPYP